jgi:hypothetical protein
MNNELRQQIQTLEEEIFEIKKNNLCAYELYNLKVSFFSDLSIQISQLKKEEYHSSAILKKHEEEINALEQQNQDIDLEIQN